MSATPVVSVIIPARNEEKYIEQCLSSLRALEYPADMLEVIVVDNGSIDATASIAHRLGAHVISAPGVTISQLRNLGAKSARGEILAFIDADCTADARWLGAAMPHLTKKEIGAVGSRYQCPEPAHWIEHAWSLQAKNLNYRGTISWLSSSNIVMRRRCFDEIGGFNEKLSSNEDVDFSARIRGAGHTIISDPEVKIVHLDNPKNLVRFFKRELWYGQGILRRFIANLPSLTNVKVVVLGVVFGIAIASFGIMAIGAVFGHAVSVWTYVPPMAMVGIPIAMAVRPALRSKSWLLLWQLSLLYFVYGAARGVTVLVPKSWVPPKQRND